MSIDLWSNVLSGGCQGAVLMLLPAAIFVMAIDVAIPAGVDVGVRTTFAGSRRSWQGFLAWFGPGRSGSKTPVATAGNTGARVVQSPVAVPMDIAMRICP